jgi:excisionase family DNA binding protein
MSFVKQFFRLDEVATLLSVHVATVRDWTDRGKLESIRTLGGHRRIPGQALMRLGVSVNY